MISICKTTLLVVFLSQFILYVQSQPYCSFTNPTTNIAYNLTNLANKDYTGKGLTSKQTYHFSICSENTFCNQQNIVSKPSSVCAPRPTTYYTFGNAQDQFTTVTARSDNQDGVVLTYETQSKCNNDYRNTVINILCTGENKVESITEVGQCNVIINMTAPCGNHMTAPKHKGLGGGWIFVIILISVSGAYIIFGSIINWKVRGQSGSNIFPNIEFWRGFGALISDGVLYIRGKISGTAYHGGYSQV